MPRLKVNKKKEEEIEKLRNKEIKGEGEAGKKTLPPPFEKEGEGNEGLKFKTNPALAMRGERIQSEKFGEEGEEEKDVKNGKSFTVKICDLLITLSFGLIFLGVPLFFTGLTWQGIAFEKQIFFYVFLLIGFFAWILKAIQERHLNIKRTPLDIPILVFIAVALLSGVFSVNRWTSFFGGFGMPAKSFFSILAAALFYWLLVSNINKKRLAVIENCLIVSFVGVVMLAVLSFISKYLGARMENFINSFFGGAGFNTIGLLSNLQIFISSAVLILLGIIGNKNTGSKFIVAFKKGFAFFALFLCLATLFILGSYTSLIGLIAGLGIIIIFAIAGLFKIEKKTFGVISFLFALTLIYILIGKPALKLNNLPSEVGLSKSASWQISKETFKERYILGVGPGNFEYAFNKYKPASFNNNILWGTRFSEATGIFYEILATLGGLGVAAFLLLILTFLGVAISAILHKDLSDVKSEGKNDLLFVALFAASVSLGIDSLIYLTGGTLIIFTIIIAALAMALISLNRKEYFKDLSLSYKVKPEYALALSFVFVCLCCGMVLIFISVGKIYLADIYARGSLVPSEENDAMNKIQKSISLFPYQYMYYAKMGDLAGAAGSRNINGDNTKAQNLFVNALNSHKMAIELSQKNAFSWESLGVLAESFVQYDPRMLDDADDSYVKAIDLDPNNPALRVRLGVVREAKGDLAKAAEEGKEGKEGMKMKLYSEAIDSFKKASELKPDLTSAYDGLARLEEKLGKLDDAINHLTSSYQLNSKNSFYQFNLGRLYYNRAVLSGEEGGRDAINRVSTTAEAEGEEVGAFDLAPSTDIMEGEEEEGKEGEAAEAAEEGNDPKVEVAAPLLAKEGQGEASANDLKIAETLFKQAILTNPKYVDALYSLGALYTVTGDKNQSREYYQKALDALPENSESRKVIEEKMGKL